MRPLVRREGNSQTMGLSISARIDTTTQNVISVIPIKTLQMSWRALMPYEHILVAVDLTEECDPVIKRARELATPNGTKVSLVHIVEPMAMAFGGDVPMDLSQLQQQQFDQAKERMDRLFNKYPEINRGDSHLTYGQPRQEIHQLAKDQKCDLIVVGSHGRHGLALLLGSTANDVLHGAPCDVL
uniref:Usp domain-containing protein n=1 Tax=Steinernema glaseri TaxID=37863 RepID=A0A1I8AAY6_9BILA